MTRMRPEREEQGVGRVAAFSDAVVAIAMTALVLPLTVLDPRPYGSNLLGLLSDNRDSLVVFVVSFISVAAFWMTHHRLFLTLVRADSTTLWLNSLWLLAIVLLPFPTHLVGIDGASAATGGLLGESYLIFYVTNLMAIAGSTLLLTRHLARVPGLVDGSDSEAAEVLHLVRIRALVSLTLLVVVMGAILVLPQFEAAGLAPLVLYLPILLIATRRLARFDRT